MPAHREPASGTPRDLSVPLRTLVAGIGHMGRSHALACRAHPGFDVVGLVNRSRVDLPPELAGYPMHEDFTRALDAVDCGVHYVDVMCQITDAAPVAVSGMGVRLSDEIAPDMYNYGHFQVRFDDGSVGWYEAGWGPMMSESAFFVKDIVSPNGAVSIVVEEGAGSADIDTHTKTSRIRVHRAELDANGAFAIPDTLLDTSDEPDHQGLCDREQAFLHRAIVEDVDLSRHHRDAVESLRICLAADESVRSGHPVALDPVRG